MGVYLSQPETSKKTLKDSKNNVSYVSSQMQGWRKNMQDAVIHELDIGNGNALFGVFDGHGGFEVSEYVQKQFTAILKGLQSYKNCQYEKALDEAFRLMDEKIDSPAGAQALKEIRSKGKGNNSEMGGYGQEKIGNATGCTANVLLMTQKHLYVANAGDSRSALCRKGQTINLSEDHKPQSPQEQKRIINAGGHITMGRVNGGLNLTRSFGDFDYKRKTQLPYDQQMITCKPDVKKVERSSDDQFILMGCDGIWERYVENSAGLIDIVKADVKSNKDPKRLIEDMLDLLLAKDTREGIGCDNMSTILIKFN